MLYIEECKFGTQVHDLLQRGDVVEISLIGSFQATTKAGSPKKLSAKSGVFAPNQNMYKSCFEMLLVNN